MRPEAQRIKIAEACGWKHIPGEEPTYGGTYVAAQWVSLDGKRCGTDWRKKASIGLPDYLNDLNAMHEAEKTLPTWNALPLERNLHRYMDFLVDVCGSLNGAVVATAAQRAEAFLRTIGKWEDDK